MSERIHFSIHPTARPGHQWRAIELSKSLGKRGSWDWLKFDDNPIPDEIDTVVVIGGDGSLRQVAAKMHEREKLGIVLAGGGGSQDAFRRSLVRAKSFIETQDLLVGNELAVRDFQPARVNELFFLHSAEFGRATLAFNDRNERYRNRPMFRDAKMLLAALQTGIEQAGEDKKDPIIEAVFTAPDLRFKEFFPGQDLYSDKLTRVTVPAMNKKDMVKLASRIVWGLYTPSDMPDDLFQIEQVDDVTIKNNHQETINLTGDVFTLEEHNKLYITRKDTKPIQIAALYIPPARRTRKMARELQSNFS